MTDSNGGKKTWAGGYVRMGARGRPTFIIEKRRGGVHFHVSTKCHTVTGATAQLALWEQDPEGYTRNRDHREAVRASLLLTPELALAYREWMLTREKPASREWAFTCANFLADWAEDLDGKDLRDVSVTGDLKPALERRGTSRKHRIEAIKAFCAYLRKEKGLLRFAEDPTLDLAVPQGTAEKTRRRKVVERERVEKVLHFLRPEVRDVLILQTGTAYHLSECRRFATSGELIRPPEGTTIAMIARDGVKLVPLLGVSIVKHKSGERVPTPLVEEIHVQAAERIRARGGLFSKHTINDAMEAACAKAGVPYFTLGVMRHSVLTWAVEMGAPRKKASEFAHHKSEKTSNTFYIDLALPVETVPVMRPALTVLDGGKLTG